MPQKPVRVRQKLKAMRTAVSARICPISALEEAENEHRAACVGLKAEKLLESADVVKRFTDDRKTDDGIDDERVGVDAAQNTAEQRQAVAYREKADVLNDIRQLVEKKITPTRNSSDRIRSPY